MQPAAYDAWYRSPRGRWIGDTEFRLLYTLLQPRRGAAVLDVGCGSGYFTRRLSEHGLLVTGVDPDPDMVRYAADHIAAGERYLIGDARVLPFPDRQFDHAIAMTSLCFVTEQVGALREMTRVSRGRVALGLLNRRSILFFQKARRGGSGAYRGAHWHTANELRRLFALCELRLVALRSAIHLPGAGRWARWVERGIGSHVLTGAFFLAIGEKA